MNTFGNMFRVTTWGESHGKAMGAVIDGCPAGLTINEDEMTSYLQQYDRPIEALATKRKEPNVVQLLSGINENKTLGTPISVVINNEDFRKSDYENLQNNFRPGHGDFTYYKKYGIHPQSGGGRASGRECISRLAAGYLAEKIILSALPDYKAETHLISLAGVKIDSERSFSHAIEKALGFSREGDTSGGEILLVISGLPAGLGGPVFQRMDAQLAGALMGIGGVKSVELGRGKDSAYIKGSEMNDDFISNCFKTNSSGGILAGITTGSGIIAKLSVKPTPTLAINQQGSDVDGEVRNVKVKGRHDKNFTPRVAKVAEAMSHLLIADQLMLCGMINRDVLI